MLSRKNIVHLVAALALATGCSVSTTTPTPANPDGGATTGASTAARPKTKPKTSSLKAKAGATPPAGARSLGSMTQPRAGAVAVPLTNVEVFTFEDTFADDGAAQTINWAYVEGKGTYLWASTAVTCADGRTDPSAAFLIFVAPDGTGTYLFSLPGCPNGDLFGCDFDQAGNDTACGACAVQDGAVACVVSP